RGRLVLSNRLTVMSLGPREGCLFFPLFLRERARERGGQQRTKHLGADRPSHPAPVLEGEGADPGKREINTRQRFPLDKRHRGAYPSWVFPLDTGGPAGLAPPGSGQSNLRSISGPSYGSGGAGRHRRVDADNLSTGASGTRASAREDRLAGPRRLATEAGSLHAR